MFTLSNVEKQNLIKIKQTFQEVPSPYVPSTFFNYFMQITKITNFEN